MNVNITLGITKSKKIITLLYHKNFCVIEFCYIIDITYARIVLKVFHNAKVALSILISPRNGLNGKVINSQVPMVILIMLQTMQIFLNLENDKIKQNSAIDQLDNITNAAANTKLAIINI